MMKNDKIEFDESSVKNSDLSISFTSADAISTDNKILSDNKKVTFFEKKVLNIDLDSTIKQRLIIYAILSGLSYAYLMLVPYLGLGMTVFAVTQLILILYLIRDREEVKNKKALFTFIPIFILTISNLIRDSYRFDFANFPVIFLLYSTMVLLLMDDLCLKSRGILFVQKILYTIFKPLAHFYIPFKWSVDSKKDNPSRILMKKILIGLAISIPCLIIITILLMTADLVFESKINLIFGSLENVFGPQPIFKLIIGTLAGLYLFGLFYIIFKKESASNEVSNENKISISKPQGDTIVINVILISILVIYTIFAIIQFKYLFAGASLPADLSYAEYARKGFFELLFLSFINIGLILLVIYLLRNKIYDSNNIPGSAKLIKVLMLYLCAITVMLLVSSFYRMTLYNNEYGFTELRLLVVIFLVFEAVGLLVTFYYIIKPKFNIIATYSVICLVFYLTINIVNIDYIIAKKNIDMHYQGNDLDVHYLYRLSADAAPQMERLLDDKDIYTQRMATEYFQKLERQYDYANDWRSFNLSKNKAMKIIDRLNLIFSDDY